MQKAVPRNYDDSLPGEVKHSSRNSRCPPNWQASKAGATSFDPRSGGAGIWLGTTAIRRENGEPSYNLFGVKASGNGKGQSLKSPRLNMKMAKRRSKSEVSGLQLVSGSIVGLRWLLTRNPRYAAVTTAASAEQGRRPYRTRAMPPILTMPANSQHDSADEIDKRQGEQNLQHEIDNLF